MSNESGGLSPSDPVLDNTNQDSVAGDKVSDNLHVLENSSQSSNKVNKSEFIDFGNKYKPSDLGPYIVFVEHEDKNVGRLFPIRIGYYLRVNNLYKKSITDIKSVGVNRVKVILNSFKAANELVGNKLLRDKGYIAYIPTFFNHKKGIVRMVDTYFDEEFLLREIECDKKVTEVKRMKKRVVGENGVAKLVDRQMIIVSFAGTTLPVSLRINGVNFPVEPYVYPVVQCFRCLRYGHTSKLCKNTTDQCHKCAEDHKGADCPNEYLFCVYCKSGEHASVSRKCPVYVRQKHIKEIMSIQNVSFKEAEKIEKNPSFAKVVTQNRFQVLSDLQSYPPLPTPNNFVQMSTNLGKTSITPVNTYQPRNPRPHASRADNAQAPKKQTHFKKRKASKSPESRVNSSILPNPYREEFMQYKEKLANQIAVLISNLICNFTKTVDNNVIEEVEGKNIRQAITELIDEISNTDNTPMNIDEYSVVDDGEDDEDDTKSY